MSVETEQDQAGRKPKKELSALKKSRKALKRAKKYLKKMAQIDESELSQKEKGLISLNRRKVVKIEKNLADCTLENVEEEREKDEEKEVKIEGDEAKVKRRRLLESKRIDEASKQDATKMPPSVQATKQKAAKRARSNGGEATEAKRTRSSLSFDSPLEHQIAIIDRSDLDGAISSKRWLLVEARILEAISDQPGSTIDEVSFDGAGWQKGVKVVGCSNKKSKDFLTRVIQNCGEIWQGARLEVIPITQLPLRKTIALRIPPPVPAQEKILTIIQKQNANLKTEAWEIMWASDKVIEGKDFVLTVDGDSLKALKESAGSIKFGLGILKARLPEDDFRKGKKVF